MRRETHRFGPVSMPRLRRRPNARTVRAFVVALACCCIAPSCLSSNVRFDRHSYSSNPAIPYKNGPALGETDDFGVLLSDDAENRIRDPGDTVRLHRLIDSYLGTPYRFGGMSKAGIDCSGLVDQIFREYADMALPRSSRDMLTLGRRVTLREARLGDLFLFRNKLIFADHVGVCIGNGRFIHASVKHGVIESTIDDDYYRSRFIEARRIFP
jgi:cell wall-associated NlpC family hydrolase